jgi:hypothetical protein
VQGFQLLSNNTPRHSSAEDFNQQTRTPILSIKGFHGADFGCEASAVSGAIIGLSTLIWAKGLLRQKALKPAAGVNLFL